MERELLCRGWRNSIEGPRPPAVNFLHSCRQSKKLLQLLKICGRVYACARHRPRPASLGRFNFSGRRLAEENKGRFCWPMIMFIRKATANFPAGRRGRPAPAPGPVTRQYTRTYIHICVNKATTSSGNDESRARISCAQQCAMAVILCALASIDRTNMCQCKLPSFSTSCDDAL